jgi:hypothetical protein
VNPLGFLDELPTWAAEGAVGLAVALFRLVRAEDDDARAAALMSAAEATKAALDRRKFPNG